MALSAAAAVLLGLALVLLIVAVTSQRDAARTAFDSQEALAAGSQLENSLITIENGLRGYVASGQTRLLEPVTEALKTYPARRRALSRLVSHDPGQRRLVGRIAADIQDYVDFWAEPVIGLAGDDLLRARSQLLTNNGRERLDVIRAGFRQLFQRERSVIAARQGAAEQRSRRAIAIGVGGLVLVFAVAAGFTLYLRRAIVRPVLAVAEATGRLAAGDLDTRVPAAREDELGVLAHGFNTMADSLARGRAELERSNSELTRSNAELEQFASVTSHDLQAPLTTISMYTELLERRRTSPREGEHDLVDGIREATQQARALIRDLLEYSRAGRGTLNLEEMPAGLVVDDALERLAGAIEETGARIEVGEMPIVLADRGNLCRVFQNLVGNAVKFTGEDGPVVRVEAEPEGGFWRFAVRDNGIGMKPEHTTRIFEPFQRLHGEEDYAGTGIGLAVCERIVDQHGGRIWVQSTPGEGSVFYFTVPGARVDPVVRATQPAPARAGA
ncbi:MAG TPA: ATP-binding protein [Solirubrobacteraceae bacterium]|nr:ATP-binding protein [Solirubrobacteraceae bacterium]